MKNLTTIKTAMSITYHSQPTITTYDSPHFQKNNKTSQNKSMMEPSQLLNLAPEEATRICEYIIALQKQTNSKDQQRVLMQKYVDHIKQDIRQLLGQNKNLKQQQQYFKQQLYKLENDNMGLIQEIRNRDQKIYFMQQQLTELGHLFQHGERQKIAAQQQLWKMREIYQKQLSQLNINNQSQNDKRIKQMNDLVSQLQEMKNKYKKTNIELQQLQQKHKLIEQINQNMKNQLTEFSKEIENRDMEQQMENQVLKQNIKFLQNKNKFLEIDIQNQQKKRKQQIRKREQLQNQLNFIQKRKLKLEQQFKQLTKKYQNEDCKQKDLFQSVKKQHQQQINIRQQLELSLKQLISKHKNQNDNQKCLQQTIRKELKQEIHKRQQLEEQLKSLAKKYQNESSINYSKQKDLQQFIIFIKQNITSLQQTIHTQQIQIQTLTQVNENLKFLILQTITNLTNQFQNKNSYQLNKIKIQLAICKGKLAQKDRKCSTCPSRANDHQVTRNQFIHKQQYLDREEEYHNHLRKESKSLSNKNKFVEKSNPLTKQRQQTTNSQILQIRQSKYQ